MGHLPLFLVLVTTFAVTIAQQQQFGDLQGEEWQKQTREEKLNKMVNLQYDNLGNKETQTTTYAKILPTSHKPQTNQNFYRTSTSSNLSLKLLRVC